MGRKKYRTILVDEQVGKFIDDLVEEGHIEERGIGSWVTQAIFEKVQKDATIVAEKRNMISILQEKKVVATKEDAEFLISIEIATLRKALKMTQPEFARFLGVNFKTIARWEQGQNMPQTQKLKHIAFKCTGNISHFDDILSSQKLRARGEWRGKKNPFKKD